ncbi:MAG TPA: hypothetical protein VIQ51_18435 [Chryseosolibacter sp.]
MTNEELLKSTVEYYSEDPVNRRCGVRHEDGHFSCKYRPTSNRTAGCAIGRHLSYEAQTTFDSYGGIDRVLWNVDTDDERTAENNKAMMPEWMQVMSIDFLIEIQNLHDDSPNWNDKGLTELGKRAVRDIAALHCDLRKAGMDWVEWLKKATS